MHLIKAFKYAFAGIKEAFRDEKNMKVHLILAAIAIVAGYFLQLSSIEWAILVLTIGFVFAMEFMNTAVEAIVDLITPEIKEKAKLAKDVAAAGVLVSAIVSVLVAVFIFLPKII